MANIINVKWDLVENSHYLDIKDFDSFVDIDRVKFYEIKPRKDGTITIRFYDEDEELVIPYVK